MGRLTEKGFGTCLFAGNFVAYPVAKGVRGSRHGCFCQDSLPLSGILMANLVGRKAPHGEGSKGRHREAFGGLYGGHVCLRASLFCLCLRDSAQARWLRRWLSEVEIPSKAVWNCIEPKLPATGSRPAHRMHHGPGDHPLRTGGHVGSAGVAGGDLGLLQQSRDRGL